MIENEALRQQKLAAQQKAMEAGEEGELSMEELAARAMAKRAWKPKPDPATEPEPIKKPSTLGVYADGGDALVSEETKETLEVAGRMTAAAGKALFTLTKDAAALAQVKAQVASRLAQEKLTAAKEEREAKRLASEQAAIDRQAKIAQVVVPPKTETKAPIADQPKPQVIDSELPVAWRPETTKGPRIPGKAMAAVLVSVLVAIGAWWYFGNRGPVEQPAVVVPVPVKNEPSPLIEAVEVPEVVIESPAIPLPEPVQDAPAAMSVDPVASDPSPVPMPTQTPKVEAEIQPKVNVAPKPQPARSAMPKPAPVKKPIAPPAEKEQWQDKGIDQLDALEKQVGG